MTFWGQGPMVRSIIWSDGVPELLGKARSSSAGISARVLETKTGRYRRGIGLGAVSTPPAPAPPNPAM